MTIRKDSSLVLTGVRNLDALLGGGVPRGSMTIVAGPPGSGKTILTQQIAFLNASAQSKCIFFSTLSEPMAKTLKYLSHFKFFAAEKVASGIEFVDLSILLTFPKLEQTIALIMDHITRVKPKFVVIDSFRVFDDLALNRGDLRKFGYEIAVQLMAWEATVFLVGEYTAEDRETGPLFSIADGVIATSQRLDAGEQQRFLQIVKMRGANHGRDSHPFSITENGIDVYAPRATLRRRTEKHQMPRELCKTRISRLDELLGSGIPWGSTLLISGVAGTGKTVTGLEFIYRGALNGERGIIFSFEETIDRLLATAHGLGWDLEKQVRRGIVEIHFIPQPDILVEQHLLFIDERVKAHKAQRVVVDSLSVFLHKIKDPQVAREKTFQLATVVQNSEAVGFLASDIPYGSEQISRFGVEETVVDGIILLSSTEEGLQRHRYIEIYKLRNTSHLQGRHSLVIGRDGIEVYPRYQDEVLEDGGPKPKAGRPRRLPSGVPGLDELLGGGLLEHSATLISGSAGIGKITFALQFALAASSHRSKSLFISFEETLEQVLHGAAGFGLPLRKALADGVIEFAYLPRPQVRAEQLITILTEHLSRLRAKRVVLDGVNHLAHEGVPHVELERLLYALANRFKLVGVTSLLTLESSALFSMEAATERDLSATADNLLLLRYARSTEALEPRLTIVKTRGSAHDRGSHPVRLGHGGLQISGSKTPSPKPRARH